MLAIVLQMETKPRRRLVRTHPLQLRSPRGGSAGVAWLIGVVLLRLSDASGDKIYIIAGYIR